MSAVLTWAPLYADWACNVKLRIVARRSAQPLVVIAAVSAQMICPAWWAEPGRLKAGFAAAIAAALDIAEEVVDQIQAAMQGLLLDDDRLSGWEDRRLKGREPAPTPAKSPASRARECRARKKQHPELPFEAAKTVAPRHEIVTPRHETVTKPRDESLRDRLFPEPSEHDFIAADQEVASRVTAVTTESEKEEESEQESELLASLATGAREVVDFDQCRENREVEFERWWAGYPHRVGKAAARRHYAAARRKAAAAVLAAALGRYVATKPPDRQWCNPSTWLGEERWLDEPAPGTGAPPDPARAAWELEYRETPHTPETHERLCELERLLGRAA